MRITADSDGVLPLATLRRWIESWLPSRPLDLRVNNTETAATPGTVTDKLPVYREYSTKNCLTTSLL